MHEPLPLLVRARTLVERTLAATVLGSPRLVARLARRRDVAVDGRRLDPQVAALLAMDDLLGAGELPAETVATARARMRQQIQVVEAPAPLDVRATDHLLPAPGAPLRVRVYTPAALAEPAPAVLYLHGGGWVVGDLGTHDALCRRLARVARCRVASVDYRLAPEHRFPAAVEDAVAAFRWLSARAEALGVDPTRLAVAGDSAGGNLAAVVARHTRGDARPPALQVLIYPAVDATTSLPSHASLGAGFILTSRSLAWYRDHYLGEDGDRRHPDVSPLFAEDLRGVAPALVYTAGFDPLRDEGQAYAERLREAGALVAYRELPGLVHGFAQMSGAVRAADSAVGALCADVGRELSRR